MLMQQRQDVRTPQELEQAIALKRLQKFTERTITSVMALLDELGQIRKKGYAFDNEECETGVRCIAAPIRDYTGRIVAGVSISGPTVRMTDDHIYANLPCLLDAAQEISIRLGWPEKSRAAGKDIA